MLDATVVKAIKESWDHLTSGYPEDYPRPTGSFGQCCVTSFLVQDLVGGKVKRGHVGVNSHYWNELPDGTELDLTLDQFGERASELVFDYYADREDTLHRPGYETNERYQLLKERFEAELDRLTKSVLE